MTHLVIQCEGMRESIREIMNQEFPTPKKEWIKKDNVIQVYDISKIKIEIQNELKKVEMQFGTKKEICENEKIEAPHVKKYAIWGMNWMQLNMVIWTIEKVFKKEVKWHQKE